MRPTKRVGRSSRFRMIGRLGPLGGRRVLGLVSRRCRDRRTWIGVRLLGARLGVGSRLGRVPYRFNRRGGPLRPHDWIGASRGRGRGQRQENCGRARNHDRRQAPWPRECPSCLISGWRPWGRDPVEGGSEPPLKNWIHRVTPSHSHTSSFPAQTTQSTRQVRSQTQRIHRAALAIARSPGSNGLRQCVPRHPAQTRSPGCCTRGSDAARSLRTASEKSIEAPPEGRAGSPRGPGRPKAMACPCAEAAQESTAAWRAAGTRSPG